MKNDKNTSEIKLPNLIAWIDQTRGYPTPSEWFQIVNQAKSEVQPQPTDAQGEQFKVSEGLHRFASDYISGGDGDYDSVIAGARYAHSSTPPEPEMDMDLVKEEADKYARERFPMSYHENGRKVAAWIGVRMAAFGFNLAVKKMRGEK